MGLSIRLTTRIGLFLGVALLSTASPASVYAAGPEQMFRSGDDVTVGAGETVPNDLFMAGQDIVIDGVVQGDVAAAGRNVVVNGTVEGDLWAAAESVRVTGAVMGDVRGAAKIFVVDGGVGRNVLAFGRTFELRPAGKVGGDVVAYADRVAIDGEVRGDIGGTASEYEQGGQVRGQMLLTVRPPEVEEEPSSLLDWFLTRGRHWLSLLIVGGLLALVWRGGLQGLGTTITERPLASLGSGLLVLGGTIAAVIVFLIPLVLVLIVLGATGLGGLTAIVLLGGILTEAVAVLTVAVAATFVAGSALSLLIGRLLLEGRWSGGAFDTWVWLGLGAVLYVLVGGLPWVGPLAQFVAALLALGALGIAGWGKLRRRGEATAASSY